MPILFTQCSKKCVNLSNKLIQQRHQIIYKEGIQIIKCILVKWRVPLYILHVQKKWLEYSEMTLYNLAPRSAVIFFQLILEMKIRKISYKVVSCFFGTHRISSCWPFILLVDRVCITGISGIFEDIEYGNQWLHSCLFWMQFPLANWVSFYTPLHLIHSAFRLVVAHLCNTEIHFTLIVYISSWMTIWFLEYPSFNFTLLRKKCNLCSCGFRKLFHIKGSCQVF